MGRPISAFTKEVKAAGGAGKAPPPKSPQGAIKLKKPAAYKAMRRGGRGR